MSATSALKLLVVVGAIMLQGRTDTDQSLRPADWDLLAVSPKHGTWFLHANTLPDVQAEEKPEACEVRFPVSGSGIGAPAVTCEDRRIEPAVSAAAAQWGALEIRPPDEPGEVRVRLWFYRSESSPSLYLGQVTSRCLQECLADGACPPHPSGGSEIMVRRRVKPVTRGLLGEVSVPVHGSMEFFIDERGRPEQLVIAELPERLWQPAWKAGLNWRFALPEGVDEGTYRVGLIFQPG